MNDFSIPWPKVPQEQSAVWHGFSHRNGVFTDCEKDEAEQSIPDRFEKIVAAYPDRVALKAKDRTLTYTELNATANRIARAILAVRGEGSEPIALVFEHGIDAIARALGPRFLREALRIGTC